MEYRTVPTICPYCGTGCGLLLEVLDGGLIGVLPDFHNPINQGSLCIKGWTADEFVRHPDRLTKPLIRRDGELVECSWDEAYDYIISNLDRIHGQHGPDAIAALASAKCTNEENYLLQKWFRVGYRTNNIDHCARL